MDFIKKIKFYANGHLLYLSSTIRNLIGEEDSVMLISHSINTNITISPFLHWHANLYIHTY